MSRPPRWMLATLPLGLLALGAAGAWFYLAQRQYLQQVASANLMAVAQAKVDQIVAWRAERLGDAAVLQENPLFTRAVARWLAGHQPGLAADILTRLRSSKDHYRYDDVRLVDRAGRVVLTTSGRQDALDAGEAAAVRAAFRDRRATMGEVSISPGDTIPRLVVVAPLFALGASATEPLGAVVHVVDAQRSLFRLVESWPSPSPSAEAVLVRRDGDSVRFLTPRRFQPDAAPTPRIALSRRNVPAVMAVLGTEGVVRGVDDRGVRVIVAARAVPGTPWFLVAKVDEPEALAVWRTRVALVFALLLGLVLLAGATVIAVVQRSAKARYRRLFEAEAALGASEARFQTLFEKAGDAFALLGPDGRYLNVNAASCEHLGYTRDELLRLGIPDVDLLFTQQQFAADFQSLVDKPPVNYHSTHRRKDGTTFPVDVTLSVARIGGVLQALSLAHDVTERELALEVLRRKQTMLARTEAIAHIGSWEWEITPDTVTWSDELFRIFQRDPRDGAPSSAEHPAFYHPEDMARLRQAVEAALAEGTPYALELRAHRKDGETRACVARGVIERSPDGRTSRLCGSLQDITELKRWEEALRESDARFRSLFASMEEGFAYCRMLFEHDEPVDFIYLDVNAAFEAQTGLRNAAGRRVSEVIPGIREADPELFARYARVATTGTPERFEMFVSSLGDWFDLSVYSPAPEHFVAVFEVITERKRTEEALRASETRFRELFNRMSSGVAVYDAIDDGGDFVFRDFNPAAEKIEKVSRTDILGKRASEVFPGVKAFGLFQVFQRVWQTGNPEFVPGNIYRDARRLEGWRENWVFRLPSGEIVAIYNDITERRQAEAALRALARHLDSIREEEHTRIARQVHDELGQALTALRLDLTWVGRKLSKGNAALRRRIDTAVALTDEMIAVGHDIVGELRPPILDDLGLVPAVEWHAQQVAKRSGVRIQVECAAEERVVGGVLAVSAYRIVQEALANVVRHAHATHVSVRVGEQDGGLTVEIRDDGQGFPEEAASDPRSFGITGMRERAASHGGALVITSAPGAGTTVRVTFPPERRKEPRAPR